MCDFPAWIDTVQLDYRRADTRQMVIEQLRAVAERCDGVRCDMAMLLLKDVFDRTWASHPASGESVAGENEFWLDAIQAVGRPGFLWMAEAYWDLEERLQELGFDYTYDKRVTDFLVEGQSAKLLEHLQGKGDEFVRRSVHFLENHDELRVAGRLSPVEHEAALRCLLLLPGLLLIHEGQLTGARLRVPVQLCRRPEEPIDAAIASLYQRALRSSSPTDWRKAATGLLAGNGSTTARDGL